ncbi:hypothetical protein HMPREF9623_02053 [Stomatobaculum longum]|uniref:NodB homology domain-containing protein n=2 Tax=Stomatobaculum longum TaxID=796942 RepID=A0AA37DFH4_9FIRM|nr:hypothetical protein HMPREF9623_02053 [Stomatobaculum longum]
MNEEAVKKTMKKQTIFQRIAAVALSLAMTLGMSNLSGDLSAPVHAEEGKVVLSYEMEYKGQGWTGWAGDNHMLTRTGTYPTAFRAALREQPAGMTGTIQYQVNVSGSGWTGTKENGAVAGVEGGTAPLEGVRVWLNGDLASSFDVYTKAQVNGQWLDWVTNGQDAGKVGVGTHIDGVRIAVVKKGETPAEVAAASVRKVDPNRPMVALSFDDGPSKYDAQILSALEANGGRATFFMVGNLVARHQKTVQRMAADGMELGNHSWAHENLAKLSGPAVQESIQKTNRAIREATGQSATLVRPPYGSLGGKARPTLAAMGYSATLWDIDTLDWKTKNADNTVNVVLSQVKDGDIVLMHSIYAQSAAAAERIIPELTRRGYQLVTVSELAAARGVKMEPGHNYGSFHKKK